MAVKVTRRQLIIGAGGAVTVAGGAGLWLAMDRIDDMHFRKAVDRGLDFEPNAYLSLTSDGQITVWVPISEMGQGTSTAFPMLVADEMDANWQDVRVEQAVLSNEIDYGQFFTAASSSIAREYIPMRRAGAVARAMLLSAGADQLSVPEGECVVANSRVSHVPSNRSLSFGELAESAAQQWAPIRPKLKSAAQFNLIGKPTNRLDIPAKVTGEAVYGIDVQLPDMVHASVQRPPFFGAELKSFDDTQTLAIPGVLATQQIRAGVAVIAEDTWSAMAGRKALTCQWTEPPTDSVSTAEINRALRTATESPALTEKFGATVHDGANLKQVQSLYQVPFLAHACMEPMNCTAWVREGICDVWVPTQSANSVQDAAINVTGLTAENIKIHVTQLGGGFGRRAATDYAWECLQIANQLDRPVQLLWTREDDIANANYRPAAAHNLSADIDSETGAIVSWQHHSASAIPGPHTSPDIPFTEKMGSENLPYAIEATELGWSGVVTPLPTQIWRSVGYSYNTFVVESFINEIATKLDLDPVAYRRTLLADNPRLLHCLDRVVAMSSYDQERHLGVASHYFSNTAVAMVAEVTGTDLADFRVTNVWCALDCGTAVNPDSVAAQMEGGIIDGLSAALYGEISVVDNAVQQSNFHDYPLLRIDQSPAVQCEVVSSTAYPSGVGEATLPGIAPALTGAISQLTGHRIHSLPIRP